MRKPGAGFVPHMRCALYPLLQQLRTDKCPFSDLPEKCRTLYSLTRDEMQNCQWLKPLLVAQIQFRVDAGRALTSTRALSRCGTTRSRQRSGASARVWDATNASGHFTIRWLSRIISFTISARRGSLGFNASTSRASTSILE
jgi:hypothetical protein